MKRLSRYGVLDAYTLEELCRKYTMSDVKGRIDLLKQFWAKERSSSKPYSPELPFKVARMAVEDSNEEVRQWTARNARFLSYCDPAVPIIDWKFEDESDGWPKATEWELARRLRNDPSNFVRACLHENPNIVSNWIAVFNSATHFERLALMRNTQAASPHHRQFIEWLFDADDTVLRIDANQRRELILAYIYNRAAYQYSHLAEDHHRYLYGRPLLDKYSLVDREEGWKASCEHFGKLWKLAQKWPHPVPLLVFYYIGADDQTRAETYQGCSDSVLRSVILDSSIGRLHPQTIALGLKSTDTNTIAGSLLSLVQNDSLTPGQLKGLEASIRGLPDSGDKEHLAYKFDDLQSRISRKASKDHLDVISTLDDLSAISRVERYLVGATVACVAIAIIWPRLAGLGTVAWLLLAVLTALILNACLMWQSSMATRKSLQAVVHKPRTYNSRRGRSVT